MRARWLLEPRKIWLQALSVQLEQLRRSRLGGGATSAWDDDRDPDDDDDFSDEEEP
jgi:hypothetical protein